MLLYLNLKVAIALLTWRWFQVIVPTEGKPVQKANSLKCTNHYLKIA